MKDDLSLPKPVSFYRHSQERMVYAWKRGNGYQETRFPVSAIERIDRIDDMHTMIGLLSGIDILVRMPIDVLEQKIWHPRLKIDDMDLLDLREVTGMAVVDKKRSLLISNAKPGDLIEGEGVYLGPYTPVDRNGVFLSKTFNVFAAPEDLPETMKYVDAVKHIAKLKKWNGYDGTNYATDKEIYAALKEGSYNGGWIIPTRDILHGKDVDGKDTTPDNILSAKDKGAFKEAKHAFKTAASSSSDFPDWYWSSTEVRVHPSFVCFVRLSDGHVDFILKDNFRLSCRPVRLVECEATPQSFVSAP